LGLLERNVSKSKNQKREFYDYNTSFRGFIRRALLAKSYAELFLSPLSSKK